MTRNAPANYVCPICLAIKGIENKATLIKQKDLVYRDEIVSVFINSFWIKTVEGHLIVVPNKHIENIYELPTEVGHKISEITKKMAGAIKKAYRADGITIRQNNEPAADQHAFHFHQHIFPRYKNDKFNEGLLTKSLLSSPKKRVEYVKKIKVELQKTK